MVFKIVEAVGVGGDEGNGRVGGNGNGSGGDGGGGTGFGGGGDGALNDLSRTVGAEAAVMETPRSMDSVVVEVASR